MSVENKVHPLAVMVSVEPVSIKENATLITKAGLLSKLNSKSLFSLMFTGFRDAENKFRLCYMIHRIDNEIEPPGLITGNFEDIKSPEAIDFINYPATFFNPYKKAILSFDDKAYSREEFQDTLTKWKQDLRDSGLELL